jgi:hypothetical protein
VRTAIWAAVAALATAPSGGQALNRPVLVGVVQRYAGRSRVHYEVVIGINPRTRQILTFDPARGMREDHLDSFATERSGAGRFALVVGPR